MPPALERWEVVGGRDRAGSLCCAGLRCTLDGVASRPPGAQKLGAAECISNLLEAARQNKASESLDSIEEASSGFRELS
jgi:hypothetical protein